MTFGVAIVLSLFCSEYFFSEEFVINFVPRHSFLYCSPFFIVGGVLYLYNEWVRCFVSKYRWPSFAVCIVLSIVFCFCPSSVFGVSITMLKGILLFVPWVCYAISVESRILHNKVTTWISNISLEIYLAQSLVFLAVGNTIGNDWAGTGWLGFFLNWILITAGCIGFVMIWKTLVYVVLKATRRQA